MKTPSISQNAGLALIDRLGDECKQDFFVNNVVYHSALSPALSVTTHSKTISPKNLYVLNNSCCQIILFPYTWSTPALFTWSIFVFMHF